MTQALAKKYICTCGTSIGNGTSLQWDMMQSHTGLYLDKNDDKAIEYASQLDLKIKQSKVKHKDNTGALAHALGAEINLLYKLNLRPQDRVILLVSDTTQGRICSDAIKKHMGLVCQGISKDNIVIKRIAGLNLHDEKTLLKQGINNLISSTIDEIEDKYYQVILNPLGGYKAMVSYITVLGMLYNKRIVYMFEGIEKPMFMPSLPFSFDIETYANAEQAIKKLYASGVPIWKEEFLKDVEGYDKKNDTDQYYENLYLSFTEFNNEGKVELSTLSMALLELDLNLESHEIHISQSAQEDYDKIKDDKTKRKIRTLIETSAKKLLRRKVMRPFNRKMTDLLRIGIPNTAERIAGYLLDNEFYVSNIFTEHKDYEETLCKVKKADYPEKYFIIFKE